MEVNLLVSILTFSQLATVDFSYDRRLPLDVRDTKIEDRDGIQVRDITYANLSGGRTAAYLVGPPGKSRCAGILFVHWYEPPAPDSNRTQFLGQAVTLARHGAISLLIETMWSDPNWFRTRKQADDYDNSVRQVKELRRALDVLLSLGRVDPMRLAYVGHDFGAMYGALLPAVDGRPTAYALQAGTMSFSEWFLLGPKLEGEARRQFIEQLAPLDPVRYIGAAAPHPVLFQFAHTDRFVPVDKAEAFFAAAKEPKQILWYDAGHGLNDQAVKDRMEWLVRQLRLSASAGAASK